MSEHNPPDEETAVLVIDPDRQAKIFAVDRLLERAHRAYDELLIAVHFARDGAEILGAHDVNHILPQLHELKRIDDAISRGQLAILAYLQPSPPPQIQGAPGNVQPEASAQE